MSQTTPLQRPTSLSVIVPAPKGGSVIEILSATSGGNVVLGFDPSNASAVREGNSLVFDTPEGRVQLTGFFALGEGSPLPTLTLPGGDLVAASDFLAALNPDMDLATAAGPGNSSGGTSYDDTAGELLGGTNEAINTSDDINVTVFDPLPTPSAALLTVESLEYGIGNQPTEPENTRVFDILDGENVINGDDAPNLFNIYGGTNTLTGGGGADTFAWYANDSDNSAADTITDFSLAQEDKLFFDGLFKNGEAGAALTKAIDDLLGHDALTVNRTEDNSLVLNVSFGDHQQTVELQGMGGQISAYIDNDPHSDNGLQNEAELLAQIIKSSLA